jgi:DNA-binding transcriptional MerR regulator
VSEHSVGELSELSGVSVRTLHHYDEIGLLVPSTRTPAGYRRYSADDAARLARILYYRSLEFSLEQIASILADPGLGAQDHLRTQHRMLRERIDHQRDLLVALEKEMEARAMGMSLTPEEQLAVFGTSAAQVSSWTGEAEERWGNSPAWQQSRRRTAAYTKDDWVAIKASATANVSSFAALLRAGEPASGAAAMDCAEAHRQHISRWFYDCGYDIHRGLAEMYVADERFAEHYDSVAPGLAQYVHDAILFNADRQSPRP